MGDFSAFTSLADELYSLTLRQKSLLEDEDMDQDLFIEALDKKGAAIKKLEATLSENQAPPPDDQFWTRLEQVKTLDDEVGASARAHMDNMGLKARQLTQNRKGITQYNKAFLSEAPEIFDKRQ